jgi:hypothetical protein
MSKKRMNKISKKMINKKIKAKKWIAIKMKIKSKNNIRRRKLMNKNK